MSCSQEGGKRCQGPLAWDTATGICPLSDTASRSTTATVNTFWEKKKQGAVVNLPPILEVKNEKQKANDSLGRQEQTLFLSSDYYSTI